MTTIERAPRWIIALILVNVVGLLAIGALLMVAFPSNFLDMVEGTLAGALMVIVPLLVLAFVLRRRPAAWAVGALLTVSILAAVGLGLLGMLALANEPTDWLFGPGVLVTAAIAPQLVLAGWATVRIFRGRAYAGAIVGALAIVFWPAVAAPLSLALSGVVTGGVVLASLGLERNMIGHAVQLQRCALLYAQSNPSRGFPASIQEMTTGAAPCLSERDARAPRGVEIEYRPAARDADGRIPDFTVFGQTRPDGDGYRHSVLADSAGRVIGFGSTLSKRAEDPATRTDGIPFRLEDMRRCILATAGEAGPPQTMDSAFVARAERLRSPGRCSANLGDLLNGPDNNVNLWLLEEYRTSYVGPVGDTGFRIMVRPRTYGRTGLRSYLATAEGRIFVTREDRAASVSDPELPACLPEDVGDCVRTPADVPPVAVFVHDTVIYGRKEYKLRPGVVGAPHREPYLLEWYVDCNVKPEELEDPPRAGFGSRTTCSRILDHHPLPLGDRVIVRLWMKKGDLVTKMIDTIPVIRDW